MPIRQERILELLGQTPGLTDREITDRIDGLQAPQQSVNQICRKLENAGILVRDRNKDGRIRNYLTNVASPAIVTEIVIAEEQAGVALSADVLSEDEIKVILVDWLKRDAWKVSVAMGRVTGVDIDALRGNERWIVEVKGPGKYPPMRVSFFLQILGETLQRMSDPNARYSIALPDMPQYRRLWQKLPLLAKERTQITALFVNEERNVDKVP